MLIVLAVAALIGTSNAVFVEYSEDAIKMYIFKDAPVVPNPITAEVINSDREFKFELLRDDVPEDGTFMYADESPHTVQGHGHNSCENDFGIRIAGVGTFCSVSFFHLGIESSKENSEHNKGSTSKDSTLDKEVIHFTIYFQSDSENQCLLYTPVFKIPSKIDSSDQSKLETWAKENEVGLLSPNDVQQFTEVRPKHGLTSYFKWLNDLLKYGVMKYPYSVDKTTDTESVTFISRPIVLSEEQLQALKGSMGAIYTESDKGDADERGEEDIEKSECGGK